MFREGRHVEKNQRRCEKTYRFFISLYFTLQEKSKNFFPPFARIIFDAVCIVCLCLSCAASAFFLRPARHESHLLQRAKRDRRQRQKTTADRRQKHRSVQKQKRMKRWISNQKMNQWWPTESNTESFFLRIFFGQGHGGSMRKISLCFSKGRFWPGPRR